MAGFSKGSLQTITRWGGEHIVAPGSRQRPMGLRGSVSATQGETRTAVLNVREMLRRSRSEVLVLTIGAPPTWLRKVRYHRDRPFRGLFDAPTGAAPATTAAPVMNRSEAEEHDPWLAMTTRR